MAASRRTELTDRMLIVAERHCAASSEGGLLPHSTGVSRIRRVSPFGVQYLDIARDRGQRQVVAFGEHDAGRWAGRLPL